jgi:hypothetical protein
MSLSFPDDAPRAEPFEPKARSDHSKAETREGGSNPFKIKPPRSKRGFRSAPSGTIESGAYKRNWKERKKIRPGDRYSNDGRND